MEVKKNPKARLENYSFLFLEIGLVLTLFCTHVALEYKTYDKIIADFETVILNAEPEEELVITHRVQPTAPPPPPPQLVEVIEIVKDDKDIEESIVETTETDETEAVDAAVEISDIVEIGEGEEIVEDVPFSIIEDAPVFPGCVGTKAQLRNCFAKSISKHVNKKFDASLASNLELSAGQKRIFVMFTIGKDGQISEIKARAPHPRLQQEAIRVVKTLPKMSPGKQRGMPVKVKYSLPITFEVVLN
ncbi:energy transducer TonB [Flavicella sediminum]|uniref:energy transducer TonB n=1 Tax=Flavicella sediminum TaxID=2585141 RepID=UPI00111CBDAC|nr:energy transducer TonB [Flavicella sediminum]